MKKILFIVLSLFFCFPFLNINAKEITNVDYKITDYFVQSDIDIAGSLNVKELIVLDGSFNGYIRDINWANDKLPTYTGKDKDFYGSTIYNGSGIANLKVGSIKLDDNVKFDDLFKDVTYFNKSTNVKNGDSKKYEYTESKNGASIKMFSPVSDGKIGFYLEYTVTNVSVKHNDVAEFYYNYIGDKFDDEIENLEIRTFFPDKASDDYRIWAHGPLNGTISKIEGNLGSVLKCSNLPANTPVDVRMTYDTDLYPISLNKNTKINALDKIIKVEKERADEANQKRQAAKIMVTFINVVAILYFVFLIIITIYIYIKYDRELKSKFNNKYNREIIDTYPVEVVDYLMTGKISPNAFTASLLNLIYKKKIKVEKLEKDNYEFTLMNKKGITENENKLITLLFDYVGDTKSFTTKDLKKKSKVMENGKNTFYEGYLNWKTNVENEALEQEFFFTKNSFRTACVIYSLIGFILFIMGLILDITSVFVYIDLVLTIIFLIYIFSFKKRTVKGNEDYHKWKAFKNFLLDFGRFDEKELPEVKLWERLLVYATVLGIAKEVSKAMKIKFENMNPDYNYTGTDFFVDYLIYSSFANTINSSVASSISTSQISASQVSSGEGFGGGFSSGGGFGGGGGGGRGF